MKRDGKVAMLRQRPAFRMYELTQKLDNGDVEDDGLTSPPSCVLSCAFRLLALDTEYQRDLLWHTLQQIT